MTIAHEELEESPEFTNSQNGMELSQWNSKNGMELTE